MAHIQRVNEGAKEKVGIYSATELMYRRYYDNLQSYLKNLKDNLQDIQRALERENDMEGSYYKVYQDKVQKYIFCCRKAIRALEENLAGIKEAADLAKGRKQDWEAQVHYQERLNEKLGI